MVLSIANPLFLVIPLWYFNLTLNSFLFGWLYEKSSLFITITDKVLFNNNRELSVLAVDFFFGNPFTAAFRKIVSNLPTSATMVGGVY